MTIKPSALGGWEMGHTLTQSGQEVAGSLHKYAGVDSLACPDVACGGGRHGFTTPPKRRPRIASPLKLPASPVVCSAFSLLHPSFVSPPKRGIPLPTNPCEPLLLRVLSLTATVFPPFATGFGLPTLFFFPKEFLLVISQFFHNAVRFTISCSSGLPGRRCLGF